MTVSIAIIFGKMLRFFGYLSKKGSPIITAEELPLRAELFGSDQMKQHGITLANTHELSERRLPDKLLSRLSDNEAVLLDVCRPMTETIVTNRLIVPAEEWLLDNFYLIEEQIRTAKRHLPKGYSLELPRLSKGPSAGRPRVYDIALETISHGDGRVDPEGLRSFVAAYQSVTFLKLGELWAIPIMLRIALIENLRRIATRLAADKINRNQADLWADQMIKTATDDPNGLIVVIADMARSKPPMVGSFVAEMVRRLQGQGPSLALPLTWIEQRLAGLGLTIEHLVRLETRQQAADQVSVSNSIQSLRFLSTMDWRKFVETMSVVDQHLSEDPADVYGRMDFTTRDVYRHVIEKIARQNSRLESEVSQQAIELAKAAAAKKGVDDRTAHVGFYLIDKGLPKLEQLAGVCFSPGRVLGSIIRRFPLLVYGGTIIFLAVVPAACFSVKAYKDGLEGWALGLVALLLLLCSAQPAVALMNWLATLAVRPKPLPRMDFSTGIPSECQTLVVVPTLLTSKHAIDDLMEAMEVRFLANRDLHLYFGLLTDFSDAEREHLLEDNPLLLRARLGVEALNQKYPTANGNIFFLFHRSRLWNPREKIWMGYERKRGKIADLNTLLRGNSHERFSLVVGDTMILSSVKYVITLDTDTLLARDSARQFVGAMAHPLNRPVYDRKQQRITEGYGILQPRVAISLSNTNPSFYARLCGSEPGIDPYTRTVSDVYQDLFGEGSFIGKGIYDVDAFKKSLDGRFPENLILSHDLLEGCYAKAGLISDVELYEEYPSRYNDDVDRRYRWIRGDWQIARWLFPWVPGSDGHMQKNPLSMLSRWKIFDNLRRSLMAASLTLLLLLGWMVLASPCFLDPGGDRYSCGSFWADRGSECFLKSP